MRRLRHLAVLSLAAAGLSGQSQLTRQPTLPVVDDNACPFEGCSFRKWIVTRNTEAYSTWRAGRKAVATLAKGEVVTGLTGVHLTLAPDRIQVTKAIPDLNARPGDIILRYMYRGEGFADIWVNGKLYREYDCSFITEKTDGGCMRDCGARVVSDGRKEWWVELRTSRGMRAWVKVDDQFDCLDSLGGDDRCEKL
jgi:hypothetical protein